MSLRIWVLTAAACALALAAPAVAQYREPTHDWSQLRHDARRPLPADSLRRDGRGFSADKGADIGSVATALGVGGAWLGMMSGWGVGAGICGATRDKSHDTGFLDGLECFENDFLVYGAVFGSYAVSSNVVIRMSGSAGCDFNDARRRALRGALLGTLPAALWIAARPALVTPGDIRLDWSRDVTTLVAGTPVLQAVGATIAASRCRHRQ